MLPHAPLPDAPSPLNPAHLRVQVRRLQSIFFSCFTAHRAVYKVCQCHLKPLLLESPSSPTHGTFLPTLLVVHSTHVKGTRIRIRVCGCLRVPCLLLKSYRAFLVQRRHFQTPQTRSPLTMVVGLALPPLRAPRTPHPHYSSPQTFLFFFRHVKLIPTSGFLRELFLPTRDFQILCLDSVS